VKLQTVSEPPQLPSGFQRHHPLATDFSTHWGCICQRLQVAWSMEHGAWCMVHGAWWWLQVAERARGAYGTHNFHHN